MQPIADDIQNIANVLVLVWVVSELIKIRKGRRIKGDVRDAGTFSVIWWLVAAAVVLGNAINAWIRLHLPPSSPVFLPLWASAAGLFALAGGILFRWYAISYLGRYFTVRVTIQEQQTLIQTGPYRWLRHPSYTGALAALAGVGLTSGSWPVFFVLTCLPLVGLLRRIRVEETVLSAHFGSAYESYRSRTWRLIPWVY